MLVPFLDAMVVARAARGDGTHHSKFSWYVQGDLWMLGLGLTARSEARSVICAMCHVLL